MLNMWSVKDLLPISYIDGEDYCGMNATFQRLDLTQATVGNVLSGIYLVLSLLVIVFAKTLTMFIPLKKSKIYFLHMLVFSLLGALLQNSSRVPETLVNLLKKRTAQNDLVTCFVGKGVMIAGKAADLMMYTAILFMFCEIHTYKQNILYHAALKNGQRAHMILPLWLFYIILIWAVEYYFPRYYYYPCLNLLVTLVFVLASSKLAKWHRLDGSMNNGLIFLHNPSAPVEQRYSKNMTANFKKFGYCLFGKNLVAFFISITFKVYVELLWTMPIPQLYLIWLMNKEAVHDLIRVDPVATQSSTSDDPISDRSHRRMVVMADQLKKAHHQTVAVQLDEIFAPTLPNQVPQSTCCTPEVVALSVPRPYRGRRKLPRFDSIGQEKQPKPDVNMRHIDMDVGESRRQEIYIH